jgi:predicted DNA-binding transcriptional regulator AlpA
VAVKRNAEPAVGVAPNADGPSGELIRGWAGICEEVRRSRVQIWRDIRAKRFPPPIETGPNSIAWFRSEIEAWKRSRPRRTYGSSQTEWTIPRTASPPVTSGGRAHRDDLRLTAEPGPSPALHPPPTQAESQLHRQYLVQQVHELGARVMFELLDEIARHPGFDDDLNELLERYVGLDGGVRGAVARAPVREPGHSENSRTEPPDAGGPYEGEQHPRAVSRGDGK